MNERITKSELIKRTAALVKSKGRNITLDGAEDILEAFWEVITDAIANGDSVRLNRYLTVKTKRVKERLGKNMVADTDVIIPEQYRIRVKPGSELIRAAMDYTQKQLEMENK